MWASTTWTSAITHRLSAARRWLPLRRGLVDGTLRDEFNSAVYGNNDGTTDWVGPWA